MYEGFKHGFRENNLQNSQNLFGDQSYLLANEYNQIFSLYKQKLHNFWQ